MCTRIAPEVFEFGEDDVSRVVAAGPLEGELLELAEDAAACCPVEAISLMSEAESPVWRMDADPRRQG
jgi:ferredoxin